MTVGDEFGVDRVVEVAVWRLSGTQELEGAWAPIGRRLCTANGSHAERHRPCILHGCSVIPQWGVAVCAA